MGLDVVILAMEIAFNGQQSCTIIWEQIRIPVEDSTVTLLQSYSGRIYSSLAEHQKQVVDVTNTRHWESVIGVPIVETRFYLPKEYKPIEDNVFSDMEIVFADGTVNAVISGEYIKKRVCKFCDGILVLQDETLRRQTNIGRYNTKLEMINPNLFEPPNFPP